MVCELWAHGDSILESRCMVSSRNVFKGSLVWSAIIAWLTSLFTFIVVTAVNVAIAFVEAPVPYSGYSVVFEVMGTVFGVLNLVNVCMWCTYKVHKAGWDSVHERKDEMPLLKLIPDIKEQILLLEKIGTL